MSVKCNAATRYSAHPFTTKTGARVLFFCLNYPRIRGWYQARVHPFSSGNGKGDCLFIYVYILYFQSIFYRQLQYLFFSGARNPLCNWCFFKEKVFFFLRETLNPHILVTKDLLQKAFGQRPFRWRLTVCLLCMAHLERMICCLSGMFLEYMEPPRTTSNQKPAR